MMLVTVVANLRMAVVNLEKLFTLKLHKHLGRYSPLEVWVVDVRKHQPAGLLALS